MKNSFITMILALFDLEKKEARICRAGHNKAIIRMNGELKQLNAKGIGLGLERGPLFESELEEVRRPLTPGGVFLFYSDGLTEAMNEEQVELGEDTFAHIVRRTSHGSAHDIQQTPVSVAKNFQGTAEQHDDITLVVVKST